MTNHITKKRGGGGAADGLTLKDFIFILIFYAIIVGFVKLEMFLGKLDNNYYYTLFVKAKIIAFICIIIIPYIYIFMNGWSVDDITSGMVAEHLAVIMLTWFFFFISHLLGMKEK
jgi:hypothetical protein